MLLLHGFVLSLVTVFLPGELAQVASTNHATVVRIVDGRVKLGAAQVAVPDANVRKAFTEFTARRDHAYGSTPQATLRDTATQTLLRTDWSQAIRLRPNRSL